MALGGIKVRNLPKFQQEIADFGNSEVPRILKRNMQIASITALRSLVRLTPVGDPSMWSRQSLPPPPGYRPGKARGGWQVRVGASTESDINRIDPSGSSTLAAGIAVIKTAGPFDTVFIFNNTPYILELERGYSRQAPSGMIRITVAQIQALNFAKPPPFLGLRPA